MIRIVVLSSTHVNALKKFAIDSLPIESCALLAGNIYEERVVVRKIIFTKNTDNSQTTFRIESEELFDAYKGAENSGFDIVGIFHSHPASVEPSTTDSYYMKINPVPWLVMSTINNELKAFLYDNKIRELELVVN